MRRAYPRRHSGTPAFDERIDDGPAAQGREVRVLADNAVLQNVKDALIRRKAKINGIELYHRTL